MNRQTEKKLRDLRLELGDDMRRADKVVGKLRDDLEGGYRWEPDEVLVALRAAERLRTSVSHTADRLLKVLKGSASLKEVEIEWLSGAYNGIKHAAKYLGDISGAEMVRLADLWVEGKIKSMQDSHEAYFLLRFGAAIQMLQRSWNAMYFAAFAAPRKHMYLDERRTAEVHGKKHGEHFMYKVREEADQIAGQSGQYVEVIDADGTVLYVAQPPISHMRREAAMMPKGKHAHRPMLNNPSTRDFQMFRDVWAMRY